MLEKKSVHEFQVEELRAIIASIYYLENEAQKAGLGEISILFRKLIADIDDWINRIVPEKDYLKIVIDSQLYTILSLLSKFSQKNKFDLETIIHAIETYDILRRTAH